MKSNILFVTFISLFAISSFVHADQNPYGLSDTQALQIEQAADNVINRVFTTLDTNRIHTLINKIDDIKMRARLTARAMYLLDYLRVVLVDMLPPVTSTSGSTITVTPITSSPSTGTTNLSYQAWSKYILAGTLSPVVAKFEVTAQYETITLEQFRIKSSRDISTQVTSAIIYDRSGKELARALPDQQGFLFSNSTIQLPIGTTTLFVQLETKHVGYNKADQNTSPFTLTFQSLQARGNTSTEYVNTMPVSNNSESIRITPFIFTDVGLSTQWNNNYSDIYLNHGITKLGILHLGINSDMNTTTANQSYKIIINEIRLKVQTSIAGVLHDIALKNLNGGTQVEGVIVGDTITFDLSSVSYDQRTIDTYAPLAFILESDISSSDTSDSIGLSMDTTSVSYVLADDTTMTVMNDLQQLWGWTQSVRVRRD